MNRAGRRACTALCLLLSGVLNACVALDERCSPLRTANVDVQLNKPARTSLVAHRFDSLTIQLEYDRIDKGRVSADADIAATINGRPIKRVNTTDPQCPNPQPFVGYRWPVDRMPIPTELLDFRVVSRGVTLLQHQADFRPFSVTGIPPAMRRNQNLTLTYSAAPLRANESITLWARLVQPDSRGYVVHTWSAKEVQGAELPLRAEALTRLPSGKLRFWVVRQYEETAQNGDHGMLIRLSTFGDAHHTVLD